MSHKSGFLACRVTGLLLWIVAVSSIPLHAQEEVWEARSPFLDTLRNWRPQTDRALRLDIHEDGLLRIDAAWLRNAGLDPASIEPDRISLYRLGREIPLLREGLEDGSFDEGDVLVFFGERPYDAYPRRLPLQQDAPYPERLYRYADSTAYWLFVDGPSGAELKTREPFQPSPLDTLRQLYHTLYFEEDRSFVVFGGNLDRINSFRWTSEKTWVRNVLVRESFTEFNLPLSEASREKPAFLICKLAGYQGESGITPNHSVRIIVGEDMLLDSIHFDTGEQVLFTVEVPATALTGASLHVRLESTPRTQQYSAVAFDWAALDYNQDLRTENGQYLLSRAERVPEGPGFLGISGFSSPDVVVLAHAKQEWKRIIPAVEHQAGGDYLLYVADSLTEGMTLIAAEVSSIPPAPDGRLVSIGNPLGTNADYLILTHHSLYSAAARYAAFIEREYNVSTDVIDVQDIYDVCAYGMFNPEALRLYCSLLSAAGKAPQYLLLLGDANIDYKRSTGAYRENLLPAYGNPASDVALTAFDVHGVRSVFEVGRLPARVSAEIDAYRERHEQYLRAETDLWNKSTLHFSGGQYYENDAELSYYRNINEGLISTLIEPAPFAGKATHFYRTAEPPTFFGPYSESDVREHIADGGVIISYVGHSATTTWDNSIDDPEALRNDHGRGSLITDFGCSSARFAEADVMSFGEKAIVPVDAQAVAYIGNAAFGSRSAGSHLPRLFYRLLLQDGIRETGKAHRLAREDFLQAYGMSPSNRNAVTMSTLLGDPILRPALPQLPDYTFSEPSLFSRNELITDVMDSLRFSAALLNLGRAVDTLLVLRVELIEDANILSVDTVLAVAPLLYDTVAVVIPSPRRAGNYRLRVTIDPDGHMVESRKDNNVAVVDVVVLSSRFSVANAFSGHCNAAWDRIRVLHPVTVEEAVEGLRWQFDHNTDFRSARSVDDDYGEVLSHRAVFPVLEAGRAQYWRVQALPLLEPASSPFLHFPSGGTTVFYGDSLSYALLSATALRSGNQGIRPLPPVRSLIVSSAGALSGNSASIRADGRELLPTPVLDGYGIVLIDSVTFDVNDVRTFSTRHSREDADALAAFLGTVEAGQIIAIATAGDPLPHVDRFIHQIRNLGSAMIGELDDRGSWALIGHRGAATGSVSEVNLGRFEGRAVLDSLVPALPPTGILRLPPLGPVHAWEEIRIRGSGLEDALEVRILADENAVADTTLLVLSSTDIDLRSVDALRYPTLHVEVRISQRSHDVQPELQSVGCSFTHLPELAMNYQSVRLERDSIEAGEEPIVHVGVINAGEAASVETEIQIDLYSSAGDHITSRNTPLPRLGFLERHDMTVSLPVIRQPGRYRLVAGIDPEHRNREQHRENNHMQFGFTVRGDTSTPELLLLIDGAEPFEGDFISPTAEIVLLLAPDNAIPVTDAARFTFIVDGHRIDASDPRVRFEAGDISAPARFTFPAELEDGEHELRWNARDMLGNPAFDEDAVLHVRVRSASGIHNLFPYPSPFTETTNITFLFSGNLPPVDGELRIYTVAGRRIRSIEFPPGALRIGFNSILWDGRDEDGDACANGVYFYKVIVRGTEGQVEQVGRVARVR